MPDKGNALWKDADLNEALKIRLRDCRERHVDLLSEFQALAWQ